MSERHPSSVRLTVKIMIISNDPSNAAVLAFAIQQMGLATCIAPLSDKAIQAWTDERPDMIVVDSNAWHGEDIVLCRALRGSTDVTILLFTSNNAEYYQLEAYEAGVDDVVSSTVSSRLFTAKVRAWLRHNELEKILNIGILQAGEFRLDPNRRYLWRGEEVKYRLTVNETRLLYQLMSHPNRLVETPILIEHIWGFQHTSYKVRLKNLVYHLRQKIESDPANPNNLRTEGKLGYRFFQG